MADAKASATAMVAALSGAALATLLGLPAGALIGSTLGVAAATAMGFRVAVPSRLRDVAFALIGISLGSGIDEDVFGQIGQWTLSLAILVVALIATMAAGIVVLDRVFGLDRETGALASSPGTMSNAIAIAVDGRGDATAVMFLQLMRLFVLVVAVPPLAVFLDGGGSAAPGQIDPMGWVPLLAVFALSLTLGTIGGRVGFPAASLLGGMLVSAGAHAFGLAHGGAPGWLVMLAFAITGAVLASRLERIGRGQIRRYAVAGAASVGIALLLSLVFAMVVKALTGLPFGQVWIAFAPGGIEAMAAIGLSLGYDPAYIAIHHFARIFALVLIVPAFLRLTPGGARRS
ncbi:AbrB family transcriptional regulator [Palleronia sp. LCG004]|uniref:AbrB family transcriptional regulator n=1 Tax=Palleronia sp. LCG004 TaxID=3079304 RepID=UPI002942E975|nr:AbrB family transcriptional regulator [Palleronia sp. LCG004]WOI57086.1 AbrB family transcriptional regulator [Palleronia sp. LCG004]